MGKAVDIVRTLREGRAREWELDTEKGTLTPAPDPADEQAEPSSRPASIPVASETYD